MSKGRQVDRVYSLIVGDRDSAVEINNLQMKFTITKSSDNKDNKNKASVEIYNLSEATRNSLEKEFIQVRLDVGYAKLGMVNLFSGQVVNISNSKVKPFLSRRSGYDIITKLNIDELYTTLNLTHQSKVVPEGSTVKDIILTLIADIPEITRNEINGKNVQRSLPDGFPIHGSPRKVLDRLSITYDLEWQIDGGVLMVSDKYKSYMENTDRVPLIGQMSGLIEAPEFVSNSGRRGRDKANRNVGVEGAASRDSLKMKILLNPTLVAGSYIKLDYEDMSGYYKIDTVTHSGDFRGNDWYSELVCSEKID